MAFVPCVCSFSHHWEIHILKYTRQQDADENLNALFTDRNTIVVKFSV